MSHSIFIRSLTDDFSLYKLTCTLSFSQKLEKKLKIQWIEPRDWQIKPFHYYFF